MVAMPSDMEGRPVPALWSRAPGPWPQAAPRRDGRLHIYLGAVPRAGKTCAMLAEGRRLAALGADVVVGLAETHGPGGPGEAQDQLERIPRRSAAGQGRCAGELDGDAVLARRPDVVLVDDLAHANAPGSLRDKRWQDVDELLRAGIDVVTTLDIAHLAELHDAVEQITDVSQREFVPAALVLAADRIDFIDTEPRVVLRRLARRPGRAGPRGPAADRLGDLDRLDLLRRLARTWLSEHDPGQARHDPGAGMTARPGPVLVALLAGAPAGPAVRRAAELATLRRAPLVGVGLRDGGGPGAARGSPDLERLLAERGGHYTEVAGADSAWELARFAARAGAWVLVIGDAASSRGRHLVRGSVARRILRLAGPVEVCVVPPGAATDGAAPDGAATDGAGRAGRRPGQAQAWAAAGTGTRAALPSRRRVLAWLIAAACPALAAGLGAAHLIGGPAVIALAVAGTTMGALAHALAGRVRRAARSRAEAGRLARLVARALVEPPLATSGPARSWPGRRPLQVFADELRRAGHRPAAGPGTRRYARAGRPQDSR
jgi:two-component system, OmpR family, sensor histidine kinase KdpD